jgi:hypothetical protein
MADKNGATVAQRRTFLVRNLHRSYGISHLYFRINRAIRDWRQHEYASIEVDESIIIMRTPQKYRPRFQGSLNRIEIRDNVWIEGLYYCDGKFLPHAGNFN